MPDIQAPHDCLDCCLRLFRQVGDAAGVDACLRALTVIADQPHVMGSPALLLTGRERQVAGLVAAGYSNREIAEALAIAEGTARRHVTNILGKLSFRSRAQIAGWIAAHRAR
jgi:DNA-binding NarL/FixJ family response regulator